MATPSVRVRQSRRVSFNPEELYVVYSISRNKLGLLANSVATFGAGVQFTVGGAGDYDICIVSTLQEYFAFTSYWTNLVATDLIKLISVDQYARIYSMDPYMIRKFARTSLGQALGCRHVHVYKEVWVALPEILVPEMWTELYHVYNEKEEKEHKTVFRYLSDGEWKTVGKFMDHRTLGDRPKWYRTLLRMRKQGLIEQRGVTRSSQIRLPPGSVKKRT